MSNVTDRCNFARRSAISSPSGRRSAGYAALRPASVAVAGRAKRSGSASAQAILQSSALSAPSLALLFALAAVLAPSHALADGGKGGVVSHSPAGGDGGLDSASAPGGTGGNGVAGAFGTGGGGGGAGVTGGKGGNGQNFGGGAGLGGAGGAVAGEAGQPGGSSTTANSGGGGGGGGAHGFVGSVGSLPGLPVIGGAGGDGGNAVVGHQGFGGGGGAGGFGAVLDGTSGTIGVAITGGAGGAGGSETVTAAGNGGNGGSGGTGLLFTNGGSFTITSAITGAAGGAGGTADGTGTAGLAGAGGRGIVGSGLNLTLGSTAAVTGGLSGGGVKANAISFTGGVNQLELQSGATVSGNVVAFSTADTLRVGGSSNAALNLSQYQGFGTFVKAGAGTWTLSNTPGAVMAWQVEAGTLDLGGTMQAASGLTLAGGSLANGTLSSSGNFNLQAGTVSAVLDGTGVLVKTGSGTVTLSGSNTYTGGTIIAGGKLSISSNANLGDASGGLMLDGGTLLVTSGVWPSQRVTLGHSGGSIEVVAMQAAQLSGSIVGTGGLTKLGDGILTLTGASTYSGPTLIAQGRLNQSGAGALSAASDYTISSGAILLILGADQTVGSIAGAGDIMASTGIALRAGATNASTTFSGRIDAGALEKIGTGTLTLTGSNTYDDGVTVSAGVLNVRNARALGTGAASVASGAALEAQGNIVLLNALTLSGTGIANGGAVRNISGNNSIQGVVTLAGDTRISSDAGNLAIERSISGSGHTLTFGGAGSIGVNASIATGTGGLVVDMTGAGKVTLSTSNSYTGGTLVSAGVLSLRDGEALGTGAVSVASGAALELQSEVTVSNPLTLSGTGIANGGALRNAARENRVTGAITLAGDTRINNDATSGGLALAGDIAGNGYALTFGGGTQDTLVSGAISGTGSVTIDGNGRTALNGANTYTGVTTVNSGILQLLLGAAIADTGAVVVNAPGTLQLSGSETIGSLSGAGSVVLSAGATLAVGGNDGSTTFSGVISQTAGSGKLTKIGAGSFTLSETSTYTGATMVSAGKLTVNGSIAASVGVTVAAGAAIGGSGTLPATSIQLGGTLAPGNSIGTLNVAGNLGFAAGSTYAVEVSPANADRVNVTGIATLGGAGVSASFAPGTYVEKQYTILNATGGVSGTFGSKVDTNLPSGFKSSLGYDESNAYLKLALDFTPLPPVQEPPASPPPAQPPATQLPATPAAPEQPVPPAVPEIPPPPLPAPPAATVPNQGLSGNRRSAADALTSFFDRNGGIPMAFGGLTPAGLSQVAGEPATGAQQTSAGAMNQFMGAMVDTSPNGRGVQIAPGPGSFAAYSSFSGKGDALPARVLPLTADPDAWRWSVWASGFGGSQFLGADSGTGTAASTNRVYGAAVGADYKLSPSTVLGFALAGGATSFNTYGLGSGSSDLFQAGAFIRHHIGQSYVAAALAYAWQDVTTDRSITGTDHLQARFDVNTWSGRLEAGHRVETPFAALTPYAAVQLTSVALPNYRETALAGSDLFALSYAAKDVTSTRSELGLRAEHSFALSNATLLLRGELAWVHNFNPETSATATFQTLPGATFLVKGTAQDRNALRTVATAEYKLGNGFSFAATFEGEFAQNSHSYGGKGAIRYSW